jgi:hypothetical protein
MATPPERRELEITEESSAAARGRVLLGMRPGIGHRPLDRLGEEIKPGLRHDPAQRHHTVARVGGALGIGRVSARRARKHRVARARLHDAATEHDCQAHCPLTRCAAKRPFHSWP